MKSGEAKQRGRTVEEPIQIVAVYGLENSKKRMLSVFEGLLVEDIVSSTKRKPPIPNEYIIVDVGVGKSFITRYMKQYHINEITEL
jgi:hypothetical protein